MAFSLCFLCVSCENMPKSMNTTKNGTNMDAKSAINGRYSRSSFDGLWFQQIPYKTEIRSPLHTWFALPWNGDDEPVVRVRPASPYWEDYQNDIKPIFQDVPPKYHQHEHEHQHPHSHHQHQDQHHHHHKIPVAPIPAVPIPPAQKPIVPLPFNPNANQA